MTNFDSVALDQQWLRLTRREREVIFWVGSGMSNKEIARQLGLSVAAVKLHVHRIFAKTGVTRYELIAQMAARSRAA